MMALNENAVNREIPSDNGDHARALMVLLLREMIGQRASIEASRRLFDYGCHSMGVDPNTGHVTPVALDAAVKSLDISIEAVTGWLKHQVIGLYDPVATTCRLRETEQHRAQRYDPEEY